MNSPKTCVVCGQPIPPERFRYSSKVTTCSYDCTCDRDGKTKFVRLPTFCEICGLVIIKGVRCPWCEGE